MSFPNIILFGDSLTEQGFNYAQHGFVASLSSDYVRRADVLNRGLSGYNSTWLLPFLEEVLAAQTAPVLLWTLWVGANDACLPSYVFNVPLPTYKQNLSQMISMIRSHEPSKDAKILIITPPPIDKKMLFVHHRRQGKDRDPKVTECYAEAAREVAKETGSGLLDYFKMLDSAAREEAGTVEGDEVTLEGWATDGLHLAGKGYELLYEEFTKYVTENWPEISASKIPLVKPWVGDLEVVKEWAESKAMESEV
ncbi:Similar to Isoamyl acetate-hydrolyzing esterase 1 homolog; acc. no. Q3SZ16 [Pyronema omphalodes CBS 100304]|uniref:Similar to Isoamyl acetate-hydrolyzing esterase 1 homolog acc. no. Q3SZ16 n=1 Tax=Pyronema omphalodes (strain CBS 100304) TaxID=1076935 RepID=U4LCB5_PYROM|nr:Similar to Isoamyl acetate-hydrolyzing esterase 1 homolog; acc. no. Q3SZ16 [Pyronema omphalodes CBS 100304]